MLTTSPEDIKNLVCVLSLTSTHFGYAQWPKFSDREVQRRNTPGLYSFMFS